MFSDYLSSMKNLAKGAVRLERLVLLADQGLETGVSFTVIMSLINIDVRNECHRQASVALVVALVGVEITQCLDDLWI